MWIKEYTGHSVASPHSVFAVLADAERWSEWNPGVTAITMHGSFAAGTAAEMVLPDGTVLPFKLVWVEPASGFEDLTGFPDVGIFVRVKHLLSPADGGGTNITYRCEVDGPSAMAAEIGEGASADFPEVISALAARAEAAIV